MLKINGYYSFLRKANIIINSLIITILFSYISYTTVFPTITNTIAIISIIRMIGRGRVILKRKRESSGM